RNGITGNDDAHRAKQVGGKLIQGTIVPVGEPGRDGDRTVAPIQTTKERIVQPSRSGPRLLGSDGQISYLRGGLVGWARRRRGGNVEDGERAGGKAGPRESQEVAACRRHGSSTPSRLVDGPPQKVWRTASSGIR